MKRRSNVVLAPAKINLALAVTDRRPDGYHSLETVFQSISLADRVKVVLTGKEGISCSCGDLSGDQNLAYQAAKLFLERYKMLVPTGNPVGTDIYIEKNIPLQAGLAGGSSDGAAVLRALNALLDNPFSPDSLLELAQECGSDTAFCLRGGTQWGKGTGTSLSELPALPEMDILLVKPPGGISTAEAYRIFDQIGVCASLDKDEWISLLKSQDKQQIAGRLTNALEQAAFRLLPEIADIKNKMIQEGCLGALMSGSGSAVFGILEDQNKGQEIAGKFHAQGYVHTWLVKTISKT